MMNQPLRRGVIVAFIAALAAAGACAEVPVADARTPYDRLASDSASADSAAFATLPDALVPVLDIRSLVATEVLDSLPLGECVQFGERRPLELRRRLQLRLADSTAIVLYAVADKTSGALEHVEFLRRMPGRGQRALTWDISSDRTTSLWWSEYPRGISRRAEKGDLPRGSSIPRAVRALGRQLLTLACPDSAAETPR